MILTSATDLNFPLKTPGSEMALFAGVTHCIFGWTRVSCMWVLSLPQWVHFALLATLSWDAFTGGCGVSSVFACLSWKKLYKSIGTSFSGFTPPACTYVLLYVIWQFFAFFNMSSISSCNHSESALSLIPTMMWPHHLSSSPHIHSFPSNHTNWYFTNLFSFWMQLLNQAYSNITFPLLWKLHIQFGDNSCVLLLGY